jgi:hypothetical protein
MDEEFEEWFEKNETKLENDFIEQNWEDFKDFSRNVYEVDREYYNNENDDYTKYQNFP